MQDSGISILFKGVNFQRLMGGLWVTLRIALITIGLSVVLQVFRKDTVSAV